MHRTPSLVLVDPRATERAERRQRWLAFAAGAGITLAAAVPYLLWVVA